MRTPCWCRCCCYSSWRTGRAPVGLAQCICGGGTRGTEGTARRFEQTQRAHREGSGKHKVRCDNQHMVAEGEVPKEICNVLCRVAFKRLQQGGVLMCLLKRIMLKTKQKQVATQLILLQGLTSLRSDRPRVRVRDMRPPVMLCAMSKKERKKKGGSTGKEKRVRRAASASLGGEMLLCGVLATPHKTRGCPIIPSFPTPTNTLKPSSCTL